MEHEPPRGAARSEDLEGVCGGAGEVGDKGDIFNELYKKKSWMDIASMLVESGSMDPDSTFTNAEGHDPVTEDPHHGRLNVVESLIGAGADIEYYQGGLHCVMQATWRVMLYRGGQSFRQGPIDKAT